MNVITEKKEEPPKPHETHLEAGETNEDELDKGTPSLCLLPTPPR